MRVMGLDVSTTTVGVAVVESVDLSLEYLGHVSLKKLPSDDLHGKADAVLSALSTLVTQHRVDSPVWMEEAVMRFTPGMSSAHTIITLARFGAMVSYTIHSRLNYDVRYVKPGEARRANGIVLRTTKAAGIPQKMQTFEQLIVKGGLLSNVVLPTTRTGSYRPEAFDQADAFIVARAGALSLRGNT